MFNGVQWGSMGVVGVRRGFKGVWGSKGVHRRRLVSKGFVGSSPVSRGVDWCRNEKILNKQTNKRSLQVTVSGLPTEYA